MVDEPVAHELGHCVGANEVRLLVIECLRHLFLALLLRDVALNEFDSVNRYDRQQVRRNDSFRALHRFHLFSYYLGPSSRCCTHIDYLHARLQQIKSSIDFQQFEG